MCVIEHALPAWLSPLRQAIDRATETSLCRFARQTEPANPAISYPFSADMAPAARAMLHRK
jgi:hypothetical protein